MRYSCWLLSSYSPKKVYHYWIWINQTNSCFWLSRKKKEREGRGTTAKASSLEGTLGFGGPYLHFWYLSSVRIMLHHIKIVIISYSSIKFNFCSLKIIRLKINGRKLRVFPRVHRKIWDISEKIYRTNLKRDGSEVKIK